MHGLTNHRPHASQAVLGAPLDESQGGRACEERAETDGRVRARRPEGAPGGRGVPTALEVDYHTGRRYVSHEGKGGMVMVLTPFLRCGDRRRGGGGKRGEEGVWGLDALFGFDLPEGRRRGVVARWKTTSWASTQWREPRGGILGDLGLRKARRIAASWKWRWWFRSCEQWLCFEGEEGLTRDATNQTSELTPRRM